MKGLSGIIIYVVAVALIGAGVFMLTGGKLPELKSPFTIGLEEAVFCSIFEYQSCILRTESTASNFVSTGVFYGQKDFICQSDRCNILRNTEGGNTIRFLVNGQTEIT